MRITLLICAILIASPFVVAQTPADDAALRKQALEMIGKHQVAQAEPLFEDLAKRHPDDMVIYEGLGMSLLGQAESLSDAEQRKAWRVRARAALLRAKELGDNSDLLNSVLPNIPEDGSASAFSDSKQVEAEMREGENQFAHGDLHAAIVHYQKAFELDPKQYYGALFTGDAFFKLNEPANAAIWFNRAIAVQPDTETAHRYFADSLLAEKKYAEARSHFIEAIIADPYNQRVWLGLNNLKDHVSGSVQRLHLEPRSSVTKEGKNINITIDSSVKPAGPWEGFWMGYGLAKASWKQDHPDGPSDHRASSLPEEASAYGLAITTVFESASPKEKQLPEIVRLQQLQSAGLLEAWILIDQPDQDIAQDYLKYRENNRDKLRRYLDDFVVPKVQ